MTDSLKKQLEQSHSERHEQVLHELKQMNITLVALTSIVADMAQRLGALQEEEPDPRQMRTL